MAKKTAKKEETFSPFTNVSASATKKKSGLDSIDMGGAIADQIDVYAELHEQIKHLEGEQTTVKNGITAEARAIFAKRQMEGVKGNFTLLGKENSVTYIMQNAGSALSPDVIDEAEKAFGKKAIEALTELDYSSMRFTKDFINAESNRSRIEKALAKEFTLAEIKAMFEPLSYKVTSDVVDSAPKYVKTADQLDTLYMTLKVKAFIKA